jgi:hypothetical protein
MSKRSAPLAAVSLSAALVVALAGCGGGQTGSAWESATADPTAVPSASSLGPSSAAPTTSPATPSPPAPTPVPVVGSGLTDEEWATVATPWGIERVPVPDPPPAIDAAGAERVVRAVYPGDRPLVWVGLVRSGSAARVGWMVVLGTATGQTCNLHPGLLERALEGGIVDATTGELFFSITCG